ncbi:MAG: hypothetical protein KatS3mg022_2009 [Armatimonadota bacterium]|nr:MAG: hypothetical protein KatS3mg022_2009 [Armatimonadota bacterium]
MTFRRYWSSRAKLVRTAQHATESFDRFVSDEQLQQNLRDTAREMSSLSAKLNRIAEDIGKYTSDEGTAAERAHYRLLKHERPSTEARQATEKINRFVERLIQPSRLSIRPMGRFAGRIRATT